MSVKENQRRLRESRKAACRCPECGGERDRPDRVNCKSCRERSNRAAKAWYAKPENAARQHENAHQRYVFLKNLRLCTKCGRERALMGRTLCEECIPKARLQQQKCRAKNGGDLTA